MLIGELPELVETRAGQDLIEIGVERGLAESVGIVLAAKRGRLSKSLRQRIRKLQHDQLRRLLAEAVTWESIEPLDAWLTEHGLLISSRFREASRLGLWMELLLEEGTRG